MVDLLYRKRYCTETVICRCRLIGQKRLDTLLRPINRRCANKLCAYRYFQEKVRQKGYLMYRTNMSSPLIISKTQARQLAITAQYLAGPRPSCDADGMMEVIKQLGCLQLDPINVVARSPLLVLWS